MSRVCCADTGNTGGKAKSVSTTEWYNESVRECVDTRADEVPQAKTVTSPAATTSTSRWRNAGQTACSLAHRSALSPRPMNLGLKAIRKAK